jgi:hypothetical protein
MKEMQCTQDITVRSIVGSKGQTFRLDTPVPVRAGQRVYYGIRTDGTPVVSVAGDTPIFDQVEIQRFDPLADVVGIAASDDARPSVARRGLGLGLGSFDRSGSFDRDDEYRLIDALTEAAELIYRVLDATATSTRQITLPAEPSNRFLIQLPR